MNYGKKSTARKEKELTSKGTMVRKKFSVIFCKTLLICFFLAAVVGICAGIGIFKGIIDSAPDIDDIDASPTGQLSTVLDDEGNEIATLVTSGTNRDPVTIDKMPINLQHAFVAIEDERFTSTTELISKESSVPASKALHPVFIFIREPAQLHSSF